MNTVTKKKAKQSKRVTEGKKTAEKNEGGEEGDQPESFPNVNEEPQPSTSRSMDASNEHHANDQEVWDELESKLSEEEKLRNLIDTVPPMKA